MLTMMMVIDADNDDLRLMLTMMMVINADNDDGD